MEPNILNYPNSQEGIDAYEADLAEYNRIQKGPMIGTEFVDTVEDVVESGVEQISKVPILRTGLQFLGGAVRTIDQVMSEDQGVGGMVYRTYKNVKEASEEGFGDLAESVGVDRRIGEFGGGELIDFVATAGAGTVVKRAKNVIDKLPPGGMSPQLATVGASQINFSRGAVNYQPPTVSKLTVTDPRFIAKGVAQGVGQSELYKAGVQKLRKLQADGIVKRKLYQEQFDTGVINEKQLKSRLQKLKKREDANYSTLGTVEDPDIFEVKSQIQKDPIDPSLPAHQHHAAGKAMTSPWVQQALKLGDDDDVVALFELHRMLTGSGMGNVKSGIIDMPGFAHIPRDARTLADVPMAVHSFMKKSGADIEILTSRVEKIIGNPKNMDELMEKYATFAAEYLIPQKELSLKRLNQVLTEHRRTLPPEQVKTFDNLVSKLNKANT